LVTVHAVPITALVPGARQEHRCPPLCKTLPLLGDYQIPERIRTNCSLKLNSPVEDGDVIGHEKVQILQVLGLGCQTTGARTSHKYSSMHELLFAE